MFERIRRDFRDEGLSIHALAKRHGVHRRAVRQALADATPPARKVPVRTSPVLGVHEAQIRAWLVEDLDAPRKQRHTARRVWQRLRDEHGARLAESTVRGLVGQVRQEIAATTRVVPIGQEHAPGEEAEVDFGEFMTWIDGVYLKLWMFALRLSHSGRAVHVAYANQAQESFLDGHVHAFGVLGGVPTGKVRYDNLKPAVIRVLLGRDRLENERFIALRSHYGGRLGGRPRGRARKRGSGRRSIGQWGGGGVALAARKRQRKGAHHGGGSYVHGHSQWWMGSQHAAPENRPVGRCR